MAVAIFPLVVLVLGVLLYFAISNPKWQEIGRIAIFCGLLGLTLAFVHSSVRVGDNVVGSRR